MANPSKAKGTKGETELLQLLNRKGGRFYRREVGAATDLRQSSKFQTPKFQILATRPDKGQWLFTMNLNGFLRLFDVYDNIDIEVKRRSSFAIHSIYERKFGGDGN